MERDFDLIRELLLQVEAAPSNLGEDVRFRTAEEHSNEQVQYHLTLLLEAEIVKGQDHSSLDGTRRISVSRLTWNGHEFLDLIRSEGRWEAVKKNMRETGTDLSFEAIKTIASQLLRGLLSGEG